MTSTTKRKRRTPIDEKKFREISRRIKSDLKAGKYNSTKVAKALGVSQETVRAIKNAKTWPGFNAQKAAKQARLKGHALPSPHGDDSFLQDLPSAEEILGRALDANPLPELETKTLTVLEYNQLMIIKDDYITLRDDLDDMMEWRNRITKKPVNRTEDAVPTMVRVSDMPRKRKIWPWSGREPR